MARQKRSPLPEGDDGRTIANMNVDGMPWYLRERKPADRSSAGRPHTMSSEEMRAYKWAAVKSGLLIVLIFGGVFALFIAFCDFIWFR